MPAADDVAGHGGDALIDRMDAVALSWVFDEKNCQSLVWEVGK
jgi:hypothetical protein